MDNKKYWFFGSRLNTVLLLILIILMVIALKWMAQDKAKYLPATTEEQIENKETLEVKDTYTYTNHGFSIELPKGFTPNEMSVGKGASISLPSGHLSYITDAVSWEKYVSQDLKYIKEEKIGETTFKVYLEGAVEISSEVYWFRQGNVGYSFNGGIDKKLLETFKFVGWPQVEGDKDNLVSFSIKPNQEVSGIVKATGVIKGAYFFEGSFPVTLLDANKKPIPYGLGHPGHANATTDWMTAGPVSFSIDFDFTKIMKGKAYIALTQDDPRDASERGNVPVKQILIPIVIK